MRQHGDEMSRRELNILGVLAANGEAPAGVGDPLLKQRAEDGRHPFSVIKSVGKDGFSLFLGSRACGKRQHSVPLRARHGALLVGGVSID